MRIVDLLTPVFRLLVGIFEVFVSRKVGFQQQSTSSTLCNTPQILRLILRLFPQEHLGIGQILHNVGIDGRQLLSFESKLVGTFDDVSVVGHFAKNPHEAQVVESPEALSLRHIACLQEHIHILIASHLGDVDNGTIATSNAHILRVVVLEQDVVVGIDTEVLHIQKIGILGFELTALESIVRANIAKEPFAHIGTIAELPHHWHIATHRHGVAGLAIDIVFIESCSSCGHLHKPILTRGERKCRKKYKQNRRLFHILSFKRFYKSFIVFRHIVVVGLEREVHTNHIGARLGVVAVVYTATHLGIVARIVGEGQQVLSRNIEPQRGDL